MQSFSTTVSIAMQMRSAYGHGEQNAQRRSKKKVMASKVSSGKKGGVTPFVEIDEGVQSDKAKVDAKAVAMVENSTMSASLVD